MQLCFEEMRKVVFTHANFFGYLTDRDISTKVLVNKESPFETAVSL